MSTQSEIFDTTGMRSRRPCLYTKISQHVLCGAGLIQQQQRQQQQHQQ